MQAGALRRHHRRHRSSHCWPRRPRMARDLAVSGVAAWLLAIGVKRMVAEGRPAELLERRRPAAARPPHGFGFPSGHVAVAAALATAAGPHLPRPARRAAWVVVALVAIGRMYVGAHLPMDVLGGAALGWAVGALVAPGLGRARPPPIGRSRSRACLRRAGFGPVTVTTGPGRRPRLHPVLRDDPRWRRAVRQGRRPRATRRRRAVQGLARARVPRARGRSAVHRRPKREIEHEAYVSLLAERAGVRTPAIVLTTDAGPGDTLLAERRVRGRGTRHLSRRRGRRRAAARRCGEQVGAVSGGRALAHRDLRRANVLVDDERPAMAHRLRLRRSPPRATGAWPRTSPSSWRR